jgi:hypothetical protein
MGKQNGRAGSPRPGEREAGDRFERDKSRGGMRNIPIKGDGVGGNILALAELVDVLKEAFETRILNSSRYRDFDGFSEISARFSELVERIKAVESDEAQTALQTFWGEVVNLLRQRDDQAAKVSELDAALQAASEKNLRSESQKDALSKADEFMAAVTERLADYHRRLADLIKRYQSLCAELEEKRRAVESEKEKMENGIEAALAEIHLPAMPAALHYANSRCVALERMTANKPLDEKTKAEIKMKAAEIEKDFRWFASVKRRISEFQSYVDGLSETIDVYRSVEGTEIQKNINDIKVAIRSLHSTFEMVGQSETFWGCVYGLHEIFDYVPPDLLIYQFNWESSSLPIAEIDKYISSYQRIRQMAEACLAGREIAGTAPAAPAEESEENDGAGDEEGGLDEDETDEPEALTVPISPAARSGDRAEELGKMVLCVLWAFIEKNIRNAQQSGKVLARGGDFGRTTKVITKLLFLTGYIERVEISKVREATVSSLETRGLVKVSRKMAPTKNYLTGTSGQNEKTVVYLTNPGRAEVVRVCDSYRPMMTAVVQKQEEREAQYKTRRGIK